MKITKSEVALICMFLCLVLAYSGGAMNILVMKNNHGKMPFLYDYDVELEVHKSFQMDDKPAYWYLSDIFEISDNIYSIGDLISIVGIFGMFIFLTNFFWIKFMEVKNDKKRIALATL